MSHWRIGRLGECRWRKHTGKVLTITGFTIFGVGIVVGFELIVAALRPSICPSGGCGPGGNRGLPRESDAETLAGCRFSNGPSPAPGPFDPKARLIASPS